MEIDAKKRYLWWVVIIAAVVVLRLPTFLTSFVNIDENEYAMAAQKILAGGMPYRDFLIYQPPVIYYFYALAFKLMPSNGLMGVHILLLGVVALSAYLIYLVTKQFFSSQEAGIYSALFYAVVSFMFLPQDMLAANCEILAVPFSLAAVLFLLRGGKDGSFWQFFICGIFIGLTALTKYQAGIILVPAVLVVLFVFRRFFSFVSLMAGFVLPIILTGLLLWSGGAWVETKDALLYIFKYAKGPPQSDGLYVAMKFIARTFLIGIVSLGVWYLAVRGAFANWKVRPFLVLWFIFGFVPVIVGGRMYFHYYFVVIPPICILAAGYYAEHGLSQFLKRALIVWGVFCIVLVFGYDVHKPYRAPTVKEEWIHAVDYLRKNSNKAADSLFVWGNCPQIYIGSGLRPSTRFTTADYLSGKTPATAGMEYEPSTPTPPSSFRKLLNDFLDPQGVVLFDTSANVFPKAWGYLKEDFSKGLPTFIVDTAPSNYRRYGRYPMQNYPILKEMLEENYEKQASEKGYIIYRVRGG